MICAGVRARMYVHDNDSDSTSMKEASTVADLTREEVEHVARLAYLRFTPEELEQFRIQLSGILTFVSELQEVDTATISPTAQVIPLTNVLREDEALASLDRDAFLANVPREEEGFIEVDAVLEDA